MSKLRDWWSGGARWRHPDLMPTRPHEVPSVGSFDDLVSVERTVTTVWVRDEHRLYVWLEEAKRWVIL